MVVFGAMFVNSGQNVYSLNLPWGVEVAWGDSINTVLKNVGVTGKNKVK